MAAQRPMQSCSIHWRSRGFRLGQTSLTEVHIIIQNNVYAYSRVMSDVPCSYERKLSLIEVTGSSELLGCTNGRFLVQFAEMIAANAAVVLFTDPAGTCSTQRD